MSIFLHGPKFERAFFGFQMNKLLEKRSQLALPLSLTLTLALNSAMHWGQHCTSVKQRSGDNSQS